MQHKTVEQLHRVAAVYPSEDLPAMKRSQRLQRWAELLDRDPSRLLRTLAGTEYQRGEARDSMRSVGSPLSVAFEDPLLRAEGLAGDTYGNAKRFFDLTDRQMHNILCYCHHGDNISAESAAHHIRAAVWGPGNSGMWAWLQPFLR